MHRILGTALVAAACVLHLQVRRMKMDRGSRRVSAALLWAIAGQYALGVLTLVRVVPIGLAVAHQAMAVALVGLWVCAVHHVRHVAPVLPDPR